MLDLCDTYLSLPAWKYTELLIIGPETCDVNLKKLFIENSRVKKCGKISVKEPAWALFVSPNSCRWTGRVTQ